MKTTDEKDLNVIKLDDLFKESLKLTIDKILPDYKKKNVMTRDQVEKIIESIKVSLEVTPDKVLIGMMLLFLQGAASAGTPLTMSVDLGNNKFIEKRNIVNACTLITGHPYIRRIAETLAIEIGSFAYRNKLSGELANRINTRYKAETGNNLSDLEMAYCSSFSQTIPNLSEITKSENLSRLLAEDYQKRFENKKKTNTNVLNSSVAFKNKKVTKLKKRK